MRSTEVYSFSIDLGTPMASRHTSSKQIDRTGRPDLSQNNVAGLTKVRPW